MKRLYPTVVLTGMLTLALGLSACSSMRGDSGTTASGASGATGATSSGGGDRAAEGAPPGSGSASTATAGDPSAAMPASGIGTYNSSTQAGMPADQTGAMGATGASGAAGTSASGQEQLPQRASTPPAASTTPNSTVISIEPLASSAGSSGSGASGSSGTSSEQAYRITLRMDDGSTQVVSQSSTPTYRSGDRVNLNSGVISR